MISEEKLKTAIKNVLLNPTGKISPELSELTSTLLEKIIKTISTCITENYPIHKSVVKNNEIYSEFVHNIFPEKTYLKLSSLGGLTDSISGGRHKLVNLTFLGLPFLVESMFGANHFQVKRKYTNFIEKIDLFMRIYNASIKENINFTVLFISTLALLNISATEYNKQINEK